MQEQYISLADLRKVSGIGDKTIERVKEQLLQNELDSNYKSEYNENVKLDANNIYQGDCLELMNGVPDKSVDMILCDLPYGTTACKWDTIIPFELLWEQYERIIKDTGAIVLFGSEPFSTYLRMSNIKNYKYDCYWNKVNSGGFATAKYKPLSVVEQILIFGKGKINYYPIMEDAIEQNKRPRDKTYKRKTDNSQGMASGEFKTSKNHNENLRYPKNLFTYNNRIGELNSLNRLHPTQKPVALLEYLIRTYTNKSEIVLDNCMGSGSTAIACINTNRNYIGIELDENYYNIAKNRINEHKNNISLK